MVCCSHCETLSISVIYCLKLLKDMNKEVSFKDLGLIEYKKAWAYQENLFDKTIARKLANKKSEKKVETLNYLLFVEHPNVYTLGKSGSENNLLTSFVEMQKLDVTFFKTNRGGDITYHGPGQLVVYPIIDLDNFSLGLKDYINALEEVIIQTLKEFNIESSRLEGATGVWLDADSKTNARKICAIGVRTSRFVSMHGLAFNINTNLDFFSYINPCGFTDKGVTSLEKELGKKQDIDFVKNIVKLKFADVFGMNIL